MSLIQIKRRNNTDAGMIFSFQIAFFVGFSILLDNGPLILGSGI